VSHRPVYQREDASFSRHPIDIVNASVGDVEVAQHHAVQELDRCSTCEGCAPQRARPLNSRDDGRGETVLTDEWQTDRRATAHCVELPSAAPSEDVILMLGAEDAGGLQGPGLVVTFAVGALVIAVAMISCAVPLRRALRIEPMQALRADA
jgi:hypothetical protein